MSNVRRRTARSVSHAASGTTNSAKACAAVYVRALCLGNAAEHCRGVGRQNTIVR